jgi:nitric oxide reductase NorD protein
MGQVDIAPWEPEESVGKIWHFLASRLDLPPHFPDAATSLEAMRARAGLVFRGLGGDPAIEIKAVANEASRHRLSLRRRFATPTEQMPRGSFDGEILRLPAEFAVFPAREDNEALYLWLAATAAHAAPRRIGSDPFRADLAAIATAQAMTCATLKAAPGLRPLWQRLAAAHLALRQRPHLRGTEAAVEKLVRNLLGATTDAPDAALLASMDAPPEHWRAPRGYRPFMPVPLWLDLRSLAASAASDVEAMPPGADIEDTGETAARKARRHKADQAERKESIILYKFEALLSWAEFMNINRRVEDDDFDNAKKAAEDHDEIGLGQVSKAPATRLKLHLDLAPEDVDRERIAEPFTYPEWEARTAQYLPAHARVLAAPVEPVAAGTVLFDAAARRRIRAVRQQFEALRPARVIRHAQPDGEELDLDATLRAMTDLKATGRGSHRIWRQNRPQERDLSVSILLDVSRSTESMVTGRAVIDIAREALTALAWGLHACGDRFAIQGFSSLKRDRVWIHDCKSFDEPMTQAIEARIAALRPGHYTRLGAAMRHASAGLSREASMRRLLMIITDGKPNDLDHYEGRHGIEDSAMAVREARRAGHAVYGVTIDRDGQAWFPRIFGQGGYSVIREADRLAGALPDIYRHLVG